MVSNRDIDSVKPKLSILLFDTINGYTIVKLYIIDIIILGITIVNISAEFVKPKLAWRREGQEYRWSQDCFGSFGCLKKHYNNHWIYGYPSMDIFCKTTIKALSPLNNIIGYIL
jgi:hypothetical protein